MTSSLVGSEMCIRDRKRDVPDLGGLFLIPLDPQGPEPHPEPEEQATPVSYTHLTLPTICSV
eukprot:10808220-Prorocentrum_lima.AAC.1